MRLNTIPVMESFRLEKTFKIKSSPAKPTTNPRPWAPHLPVF